MDKMKHLYASMDKACSELAGETGFTCKDCKDNCCVQRFHHYTLAEYHYLLEGVRQADDELVGRMLTRASVVTDTYLKEIQIGEILKIMCPVNEGGMCRLYEWRPMICRLHGLPHSFQRPDGEVVQADGCHRFKELAPESRLALDRTPFYRELADIERELRIDLGHRGKYKKTTAEMLMGMVSEDSGGEAL